MKQYIKKLWKDVCITSENIVLTHSSILTIKQVKVFEKLLGSTKSFLFGDGELLAIRHFDDLAEYRRILRLLELYPLSSPDLMKKNDKTSENEILIILKIRGGTEELEYVAKKAEELLRSARRKSPTS